MKIGVLALQGDFIEHQQLLAMIGVESTQVRLPAELNGLDGVIIPGGESTTIGKMAEDFNMLDPLREFGSTHAIFGTCAGSILLSRDVRRTQPLLGLMDIRVARNAFGRQVDSFETDLEVPCLAKIAEPNPPFHAVFIRAPLIEDVSEGVEVLARLPDGDIVAAQQGRWLATSFHPELTRDARFHQYFVEMAR